MGKRMQLTNKVLTEITENVSPHEFGGMEVPVEMAKEILEHRERWEALKNYIKVEQRRLDTLIKKPTRDSKNHIDNRTLNDFNSRKYDWHTLPPHLVRMGMMELQEWRELNDEG